MSDDYTCVECGRQQSAHIGDDAAYEIGWRSASATTTYTFTPKWLCPFCAGRGIGEPEPGSADDWNVGFGNWRGD